MRYNDNSTIINIILFDLIGRQFRLYKQTKNYIYNFANLAKIKFSFFYFPVSKFLKALLIIIYQNFDC